MSLELEITVVSDAGSEFRGWGARAIFTELTGRRPVYATRTRAWICQTSRVADLAALAERKGFAVRIIDQRAPAVHKVHQPSEPPPGDIEHPDPARGLW